MRDVLLKLNSPENLLTSMTFQTCYIHSQRKVRQCLSSLKFSYRAKSVILWHPYIKSVMSVAFQLEQTIILNGKCWGVHCTALMAASLPLGKVIRRSLKLRYHTPSRICLAFRACDVKQNNNNNNTRFEALTKNRKGIICGKKFTLSR